jgi:hypothetical protein
MEIYTTIPPTPIMTEVVVKIMVELDRGDSVSTLSPMSARDSMCHREVHQKVTGGEQDRGGPPKIGSTDPR